MKTYKILALCAALLLTSAESIAIDRLFTHASGHAEIVQPLTRNG